jgi:uncharacterized protein
MTLHRKSLYIDANIFLNAILYSPDSNPEAARAVEFLEKVIHNEVEAHTSWLTWDEVIYIIRRNLGSSVSRKKGQEFLAYPNLIFENVTYEIIRDAQSYLEKYNIKPRDAIHLSTSLKKNITEIITFDDNFKGISEITYHAP